MTDYTQDAIDAIRRALATEQRGFADWLSRVLAASVRDAGPEGVDFAPRGSWQAKQVAELIYHGEDLEGEEPS